MHMKLINKSDEDLSTPRQRHSRLMSYQEYVEPNEQRYISQDANHQSGH